MLDLGRETHFDCYRLRIAEEVIMNKSQLVGSVNASTSHSRRVVGEVVDVLFDTIIAEVRSGRKVSVIGFGTFNPIGRAARIGRNPRTGAVVPIPASKGVRFATGSTFKSALNPKEGAPMAVKKATKKKAAAKKAPARKTAARKSTAKKAPAKRAVKKAVRKVSAKKTTAKRAVKKAVRKTTAKRAPARKTAAKKVTKRAPARKTAAKKVTKRAPARKTAAKKVTKRAPARKTAAKKVTKRAPARKAAKRR
jgi:DNA-binding protein HU-beta